MRTKSMLTALAVVVLGITLAACNNGSGSASNSGAELKQIAQQRVGDYVVTLLSESGQLKQGKNKYALEFRKAADNQLVDVGEVKLSSRMPMPGMSDMIGGASATPSGTPGRYMVESDFEMRGKWNFGATFGNNQRVMFPINVQ
ncbi:MAG: FixH family protein [Acidobacteria bacterium]|nr:FixH family protein [Acidobacteriota bacterium]